MRLIVLPGMDGGASLSRSFRAEMIRAHEVIGVEYPPTEAWSHSRIEEDVRSTIGESDESTLLIAESFSGPVAIRIAAAPPDSVVGVVLVATLAVAPFWPTLRHFVSTALFWPSPPAFALRRWMLDADASDASVRALMEAIERPAPNVMAERLRELLAVDVRDALARIELPTLVLRPTRDRLVPSRSSVSRHRPDLPTHELEAPHLVLHTRPQAAAAVVSRFAAELK